METGIEMGCETGREVALDVGSTGREAGAEVGGAARTDSTTPKVSEPNKAMETTRWTMRKAMCFRPLA